jgi:hypothetical protein
MTPPVRQRLHLGAARMLAAEGCPSQEVAVHLLEGGHSMEVGEAPDRAVIRYPIGYQNRH